jgi:DNA repair protein RecN (Recombination protein N)
VQSTYIELKDLANEIDYEQDSVEIDDQRAEKIRQRLTVFYQLQTKHQAKTVAELIVIRDELEQKVSKVLNLDDALTKAKAEVEKNTTALTKSADKLTASRKVVLPQIEKAIKHYLLDLGIPNAEIAIQHQAIEPSADGTDSIEFLFTANKGIKPQPLKNVASGGEFSRLMMVIKYILASKRRLPTIVFDEIDTGVSGEIAIKMGNMMLDMAHSHQIIAISHLPQIASQGTAHYFVYKDNSTAKTMSRIKRLSYDERVVEIAQMIGGKKPSEAIVQEVRELLNQQLLQSSKVQTKLF